MMQLADLVPVVKLIGLVCPSLYAGFTMSDSLTFVGPIVSHASNQKIAAKQWLHGYQYGPAWVPPLIAPGVSANLLLAYLANTKLQQQLYVLAGLANFTILFIITFLYMEPGINGALKWKVQTLLKDEGFNMKDTPLWSPSAYKHGSTQASRKWAEKTDVKELILVWRRVNNWRWVIAVCAVVASGYASLST
ncbi:hypothetical protein K431DRAFT_341850 [Polychaeton citri CBS 116435]|uniref:DUF1772-domain-containing protein n=1 Tax=Polychaeton citri CBS 116435 TaxID=1314669 RepID=A0A9P4PYZ5_9PEZI|nr:hypothetical protein K431DRAFT_341850 [Polychaeton citri CBS 116435]